MRQFAARRILAIPSLIKTLLPMRTVAKDCCLRILLSQPLRSWFRPSGFVGQCALLRSQDFFVGRFRGLRIYEPFMNVRFEFLISLYTFRYRRSHGMHVVHNSKTAVEIRETGAFEARPRVSNPRSRHSLSELRLRRLSSVVKSSVEATKLKKRLMQGSLTLSYPTYPEFYGSSFGCRHLYF